MAGTLTAAGAGAGAPDTGRRVTVVVAVVLAALSVAASVPVIRPLFAGGGTGWLLAAALVPGVIVVVTSSRVTSSRVTSSRVTSSRVTASGAASFRNRGVPSLLRVVVELVAGVGLLALLPGGALHGLASGGARLVTVALPASPLGPELGVAVGATYLASMIAVELASSERGSLAALVPGALLLLGALLIGTGGLPQPHWAAAAYAGIAALAVLAHRLLPAIVSGSGPPAAGAGAGGAAGATYLAAGPGAGRGRVLSLLPRALGGVVVGVAVAVFAIPLAGVLPGTNARQPYNLRDAIAPAPLPRSEVNLLATFAAVHDGPVEPVFSASVTGSPGMLYWRLATFDRFDGAEWTSSQRFRRASTRLPDGPEVLVGTRSVHVVIHPLSDLTYLPVPDRPREVSVAGLDVATDDGSLAVPEGFVLPARISVTSVVPDLNSQELQEASVVPGETNPGAPPIPQALHAKAVALEQMTANPNPFARLTELQQYLTSAPFRLHPPNNSSPIGSGYFQVSQLLETHVGSPEQYAAAFAILARAMGFQSRLAIGYTGGTGQGGTTTFTTRDLLVWPEVSLDGIGWVPFPADPSATATSHPEPSPTGAPPSPTTTTPLQGALQQQHQQNQEAKPSTSLPPSTAAPAPPVRPAPQSGGLPGWIWAPIGAVLALVLAVGAVLLGKYLRRRNQRLRSDPAARLSGAWEHTLDRLAEYQVELPATLTAPEVAERASVLVGTAAEPLRELAGAVDAARYDRRNSPPPDAADDGWRVAESVEDALGKGASVRARAHAALSLAPFLRRRG